MTAVLFQISSDFTQQRQINPNRNEQLNSTECPDEHGEERQPIDGNLLSVARLCQQVNDSFPRPHRLGPGQTRASSLQGAALQLGSTTFWRITIWLIQPGDQIFFAQISGIFSLKGVDIVQIEEIEKCARKFS